MQSRASRAAEGIASIKPASVEPKPRVMWSVRKDPNASAASFETVITSAHAHDKVSFRYPKLGQCPAGKWRYRIVERNCAASFDHFIGGGEQFRRHNESERGRGVDVNGKIELGRLLNGNIAGLR